MKKILLFLLTLLLPLVTSAAYLTFQVDGIYYEQREAADEFVSVTYTPTGVAKYTGDVVIPAAVTYSGKTYPVKRIGQWAFWECTGLKTIVLPEGLEAIDNSSFYGCTQLKAVTFPSTLRSLNGVAFSNERGAFENCTGLKSVYFPATMITDELWTANIGWASFKGCTGLKTIFVAGSKTAIAMYDVFSGCTGVTDFVSYIENPDFGFVSARDFEGFAQTASLIVPDGKKDAYQNAREWYTFQHIYERSSYGKAFAVLTAGLGGKLTYSNEDIVRGTQVYGIQKGQGISVTITPDEGHKLLRLLKDGQDVSSGVSNGKYTVSNIQKDFTLEAVFEEGGDTPPAGEAKPYVVYDNGTLTFYCDNQRSSRQGTTYDLNTGEEQPVWLEHSADITKAVFDASFADARPTTTNCWFYQCNRLTAIDNMSYLNTSSVSNMQSMFTLCESLTNLDVSNFNTSAVTDMGAMFMGCSNLTSLDLSHFNTNAVKSMEMMFLNCTGLTSLDVSNFDTSSVGNMMSLFHNCSNLSKLTFGQGFVSSSAVVCVGMFAGCSSLKTVAFIGDIPASIYSYFFSGVGTADAPATLEVPQQYREHYAAKFIDGKFCGGYFTLKGTGEIPVEDAIVFADPIVEALCLYYWDMNKDGKLTKQEAAAVTSLGDVFCLDPNKTKSWQDSNGPKDGLVHGNFTSFDELQYFTGLTAIDEGAFYSQQSLQSITLPASIKTIGKSAFYYCWNLKAINVPNSVETIGDGAFSSCKNAESLVLGRSVKTIGNATFRGCGKLTEVVIPEGCTSIGGSAFFDCAKLTKVTLPASLKNVGAYMIAYTEKTVNIYLGSRNLWQQLNIVYLADDNEDEDGIVEQSDYRLYYNGQELTEVELQQTMTSIGNNFKNCQSIKSLTIPKSITSMAVLAFNGCRNLTSVTSYIENPFYIEDAAFEYADPNTHKDVFTSATLYVPKGTKAKYQSQYGWKNFKNIVEMGGEPAEAESYVVYNDGTLTFYCDNLRSSRQGTTYDLNTEDKPGWHEHSADITKAVFDASFAEARPTTTYMWFNNCTNLKEIYSISNLNTQYVTNMVLMFSGCISLTSLDLSSFNTQNVTNMGCMFLGSSSLTSLDLSSFNTQNVTDMSFMFYSCSSLTSLDVSSFDTQNVTNVTCMFDICNNLLKLILGQGFVTSDAVSCNYVFAECRSLNTVVFTGDIPASINSMFFDYVGYYNGPATLDVPQQYRDHYKAKFNGNMFFGGYFKLSGEGNEPLLKLIYAEVTNAIENIVYADRLIVRSLVMLEGDETFEGSVTVTLKQKENSQWVQKDARRLAASAVGRVMTLYFWALADGVYQIEWSYQLDGEAASDAIGSIDFEVRNHDQWKTIAFEESSMMTYCDADDLDFKAIEGLKAYTAGGFNTVTGEAQMMRVTDVPAETGLLLVGEPWRCYLVPRSTASTIYVNLLKGNSSSSYGMSLKDEADGFTNYYFDGSTQTFRKVNGTAYISANSAYLQIPTQAAASRGVVTLKFDDTNSIAEMENDGQPFDVYSLSGTLVKRGATSLKQLPRGIYVAGRRKVLKK